MAIRPPKLLTADDVVRIEIETIGDIEHAVIVEPNETEFV